MTPSYPRNKRGPMMKRTILVPLAVTVSLAVAVAIVGQGRGGGGGQGGAPAPPVPQIASPNVTPDRLLKAAAEPQNWLMYSGTYGSQRHSGLTQITPANAKDLTLKW